MKSNLPSIMKGKKVTIRALEEMSGVNNVTICRARKSEKDDEKKTGNICNCTLGTLDRIARALGVSVHDLFDDTPDQTGQPDK